MKMPLTIITSRLQRDLTVFGLELQHKLATDTSGNLKRLDQSDKGAQDLLGVNAFLSEAIAAVTAEEEEAEIGVNASAARVWQNALVLVVRHWTRLDRANTKAQLVSNRGERSAALQELVDQIHKVLDMPLVSLESLAEDDVPADAQHVTDPGEDAQIEIDSTVGATAGKAPPKKGRGAKKDEPWDTGAPKIDKTKVRALALDR